MYLYSYIIINKILFFSKKKVRKNTSCNDNMFECVLLKTREANTFLYTSQDKTRKENIIGNLPL